MLSKTSDYEVTVGDSDETALTALASLPRVQTTFVDAANATAVASLLHGRDAVVSACSFAVNPGIAEAALAAGASYFDLTEDVASTRAVRQVAANARAGQIFMPQCGLAPGFIAIAGYHLTRQLDTVNDLRVRVGALPLYPNNRLKYNLTWSTLGLVNEYCQPCEAIRDGVLMYVPPLEGLENFPLDGVDYEAFNTSGGLGSLSETLNGRVRNLDYKTIRYCGHRDLLSFLIDDLRLGQRPELLVDILEHSVPTTMEDVVLVFCSATGVRNGRFTQVSDMRKIYYREIDGQRWSAIQLTTAAGLATVVDLHRTGRLPQRGFVRQEEVSLETFLANRFGQYYSSSHVSSAREATVVRHGRNVSEQPAS
jgi:saccharopine dehydrogenase-like NADP-dependent oxidoreductase